MDAGVGAPRLQLINERVVIMLQFICRPDDQRKDIVVNQCRQEL